LQYFAFATTGRTPFDSPVNSALQEDVDQPPAVPATGENFL
jgi:hypothetical protein